MAVLHDSLWSYVCKCSRMKLLDVPYVVRPPLPNKDRCTSVGMGACVLFVSEDLFVSERLV